MGLDDIGADRLAYGYAITAHRAQGTTFEVAHVLSTTVAAGSSPMWP
jgi:ATP-dependent exoDNAse (exonuclease V) alpha subunit